MRTNVKLVLGVKLRAFSRPFRFLIDVKSFNGLDQRVHNFLFIFACTNSVMDPIVYGFFNLRKSASSAANSARNNLQINVSHFFPIPQNKALMGPVPASSVSYAGSITCVSELVFGFVLVSACVVLTLWVGAPVEDCEGGYWVGHGALVSAFKIFPKTELEES